jgi:hypothetical protein
MRLLTVNITENPVAEAPSEASEAAEVTREPEATEEGTTTGATHTIICNKAFIE